MDNPDSLYVKVTDLLDGSETPYQFDLQRRVSIGSGAECDIILGTGDVRETARNIRPLEGEFYVENGKIRYDIFTDDGNNSKGIWMSPLIGMMQSPMVHQTDMGPDDAFYFGPNRYDNGREGFYDGDHIVRRFKVQTWIEEEAEKGEVGQPLEAVAQESP